MNNGKHLLVEVVAKNNRGFKDKRFIKRLFREIIEVAEMKAVSPTLIYQFPPRQSKLKSGLTAFCVLAESHLSIHTWPENNYFALDLFSCRDFNEKKVISLIKKNFAVKKIYIQVIKRGLGFIFKGLRN